MISIVFCLSFWDVRRDVENVEHTAPGFVMAYVSKMIAMIIDLPKRPALEIHVVIRSDDEYHKCKKQQNRN
jgi:hypothetical protein